MVAPETFWKDNTSAMKERELAKTVSSNAGEVSSILADILAQLPALKDQSKKVLDLASNLPDDLSNGISLLDVKSQFLFSYDELLLTYLLLKVEGADLSSHPLFASLVRERYLISPSPHQIAHGEARAPGAQDENTHRQHSSPARSRRRIQPSPLPRQSRRPRLFLRRLLRQRRKNRQIRRLHPSKNRRRPLLRERSSQSAHWRVDSERDEQRREQLRERVANNQFVRELRNELSDRPEAIDMRSTGDLALDRELRERNAFEESNFTRVNLSREQKKKMRQASLSLQRGRKIGEEDDFDSLTRLVRESEKVGVGAGSER